MVPKWVTVLKTVIASLPSAVTQDSAPRKITLLVVTQALIIAALSAPCSQSTVVVLALAIKCLGNARPSMEMGLGLCKMEDKRKRSMDITEPRSDLAIIKEDGIKTNKRNKSM